MFPKKAYYMSHTDNRAMVRVDLGFQILMIKRSQSPYVGCMSFGPTGNINWSSFGSFRNKGLQYRPQLVRLVL